MRATESMPRAWRWTDACTTPCRIWATSRPSTAGRRLLETNIFGFEGDLYGRRLRVELLRFIRPERRFGSVEELFRQIGDDRREVCGGGGEPLDPR